jgi:type IV secretory pathway VirB2 component (pilin)
MIKKLFSQTFYSLFFLILLMINGVDAMAAANDNNENFSFTAAEACSDAARCSSESTASNSWDMALNCPNDSFVRMTGPNNIVRSFKKCDSTDVEIVLPTLIKICNFYCEQIKSLAKGDVADEKADTNMSTFSRSMCNALKVVTGSAGKTFAAFAIIATGIGFFTGKVSWGLMIGVTAGIATMFGAPSIVAAISGQDVKTNCNMT